MVIGDAESYERAKRLLNAGKHPTFVGRDMVGRNAKNGGLLIFRVSGEDLGVMVVNARQNVLLVMTVHPAHRGHGLGAAMLEYCKPSWVRALESAAPWFVKRGYTPIGKLKQGRSLRTQLMVRAGLPKLAGRLKRVLVDGEVNRSDPAGVRE